MSWILTASGRHFDYLDPRAEDIDILDIAQSLANECRYAGHTAWNVHRGKDDAGEGRRRPRSEWIVQRGTHAALITDEEAEAILARLEGNKAARAVRARISDYLLTGILRAPDGAAWWGNAGNYRIGGANIRASMLEEALLAQVAADLRTDEFVAMLTTYAQRAQSPGDGAELAAMAGQVRETDTRINRLMGLIEQTDEPGPMLRRIEELERERKELVGRLAALEDETRRAKALAKVRESDVRRMLDAIADDMAMLDRGHLKAFLKGMIESVTLDPATRAGEIRYRIGASGVKVASPRGFGPNPTLRGAVPFLAPRNKRVRKHCVQVRDQSPFRLNQND